MPHTGIHAISARQNKMDKKMGLITASSAAEQQLFLYHLPRSRHSVSNHCQPLQPTALTSISHFIMSHHNSRRLAGSALLGDIDACKSRRSQISALLAGFAALVALAGVGRRWQPQRAAAAGAGGRAMGWTTPPHHNIIYKI